MAAAPSGAEPIELFVIVEALASELRASEIALAHWQAHAIRLRSQLRAARRGPDHDVNCGAPHNLLPRASAPAGRTRENSGSSTFSFASTSTFRAPAAAPPPPPFLNAIFTREFWDPKEAQATQRRETGATLVQALWRGARQRRRYRSASAFFAIVNDASTLRSSGRSVPAYTITVVRGGDCWQVSHRFSDWLELDKQLVECMPAALAALRPSLPARYPFRSARLVAYRQLALNKYLQQLLPLVERTAPARRTLLAFLSRSHIHWLYADHTSVLLASCALPPTARRLAARHSAAQASGQRALVGGGSSSGGGGGGGGGGGRGGREELESGGATSSIGPVSSRSTAPSATTERFAASPPIAQLR